MNDDFYYALLTGWFILVTFWSLILVFIFIRKPPKSKLTKKMAIQSMLTFLIMFILIILLRYYRFVFL